MLINSRGLKNTTDTDDYQQLLRALIHETTHIFGF